MTEYVKLNLHETIRWSIYCAIGYLRKAIEEQGHSWDEVIESVEGGLRRGRLPLDPVLRQACPKVLTERSLTDISEERGGNRNIGHVPVPAEIFELLLQDQDTRTVHVSEGLLDEKVEVVARWSIWTFVIGCSAFDEEGFAYSTEFSQALLDGGPDIEYAVRLLTFVGVQIGKGGIPMHVVDKVRQVYFPHRDPVLLH